MRINLKFLIGILWLSLFVPSLFAQKLQTKMPSDLDKSVSEPTSFASGIISTGDYEGAEEFSPDGKTLYHLKLAPDFNFWTLVFSRFENGKWTVPKVAPFSDRYSDSDPFITSDGKRMFFVSRRPKTN